MTRTVAAALLLSACYTELPTQQDPCADWREPGLYVLHVDVDGKRRKAFVHVPEGPGPRDLVVALHGAGSDAEETARVSGYIPLSNQHGFVVAFPEGTDPIGAWAAWNAGDCCLTASEGERDVADRQFLDALTAQLEKQTCADRVLATGFSNGSMMTHRWACESDRVDVAVPIAGTPMVSVCRGDPLPIRHYHGTKDPIVPIDGATKHGFPTLDDGMAIWRKRNQCAPTDPQRTTDGRVTCEVYDCAAPTEVCLIDGWDHRWPGGPLKGEVGFDATVESLRFFAQNAPTREEP